MANTCASEIKRYIALILAMGIISQSDINEYWSTEPVTSTPFFSATMSRDRFLLITSFLHLANIDDLIPRENPGHNPLLNSNLFSNYDISFQFCLFQLGTYSTKLSENTSNIKTTNSEVVVIYSL